MKTKHLEFGQVTLFLEHNGFTVGKVNQPKGFWKIYPLHLAVEQNNSYITEKLLMFGAHPWVCTWMGRTPYGYAQRHPATHQDNQGEAKKGNKNSHEQVVQEQPSHFSGFLFVKIYHLY